MKTPEIIIAICDCPERQGDLDVSAIKEILAGEGIRSQVCSELCRIDVFSAFLKQCRRQKPKAVLIAGCGKEIAAESLERQIKKQTPSVSIYWEEMAGVSDPFVIAARIINWHKWVEGKLSFGESLPLSSQSKSSQVLIVGGGVGGCQVALDLADAGHKVILAEKTLSLGGTMAKLDKTFPTLDCSICILGPRLVEVANHPDIELLTPCDVTSVGGFPGSFQVDVTLWPRFVDMTKCSGCGKCAEVCPIIIPSDWNLNLKPIKAIHVNFEQAVPLRSAISKEFCVECRLCENVCEREAICLDDQPSYRKLDVGAIVLATGAQPFPLERYGAYGYGYIPAVISNLEFERLVCATGPTSGRLVTPEGAPARKIAFVQCVGSRNQQYNPYCSIYCCTASIKEAVLALEHEPYGEVTIFYNDVRTPGKGFEELYRRAIERGVFFVKGIPSAITEDPYTKQPIVHYYDMKAGERRQYVVDLAVLAGGLVSRCDRIEWKTSPGPKKDAYGFYEERERTLHSLESSVPGIFFLGTCHGPRDITQTVAEASGVAARVQSFLS